MTTYTVETTYHLPVFRHRTYSAETLEQACRAAIEDDDWDDAKRDYDASGETYVTGVWEGGDAAYRGTAIPVPARFEELVQRKADLFEVLVALLREPAQPMGLSQIEFERWLPRAFAALADADAIIGDPFKVSP